MDFNKRKITALATMASTEHDKSPKGTIDTPILPLLNTLNSHPSFFTTSSCSGRISIFAQSTMKSKGGSWVFISHELVDPNSIINLIFPSDSTHLSTQNSNLVFRFEPLIIAVECIDVDSAQLLVSIAISCGLRESGITSVRKRVIVAIRSSLRLEVPLGDTDRIMVSMEFIRYVVRIANEKMDANWRRSDRFLSTLQSNGFMAAEYGNEMLLKRALDDNNVSKSNDGHGCLDMENNQSHVQRR